MVIKKVLKVGSSLMVVIPTSEVKAKGIKVGDFVDCSFQFVTRPETNQGPVVVKEELINLDKLEEVTFEIGKDVHVEVVEKKLEPETVIVKEEEKKDEDVF